ncbi:MAG: fimbrillin family protein [Prevotella sp.]|nr:fimbrillin family protein [Prevotella sp.]
MKKMRRYLFLMISSVLLAACNNDVDNVGNEGYVPSNKVIVFDAAEEGAVTRANGMIDDNVLKTKGFGVFGCYTGDMTYENTTVSSDFMYNQLVTYNSNSRVWEYSPLKYWPNNSADYVSFFAYAPYEATPCDDGRCIIDMSKKKDLGDPWINYRLAEDPWNPKNPQVDLLYGQQEQGYNYGYSSWLDQQKPNDPVDSKLKFTFRHALACIGDEITIRLSPRLISLVEGYVTSIKITNVTINYKNLTTKARLVLRTEGFANWKEIISGELAVTRTYNKEVEVKFSPFETAEKNISSGDGLFYIPLKVAEADPMAEVTIAYTVTNNTNHSYSGTATTSFPLSLNMEGQKQGIALQLTETLDLQHLVYTIGNGATEPSYSRQR